MQAKEAKPQTQATKVKYQGMIAHAIFALTDRVTARSGVSLNSIWKFV